MRYTNRFIVWGLIFIFFTLWTLRILYLSIPEPDQILAVISTLWLQAFIFLGPCIFGAVFLFKESLQKAFSLYRGTLAGWIASGFTSLSLLLWEIFNRTLIVPPALPLVTLAFIATIHELVFRGFIFTYLFRFAGKFETIVITAMLSALIYAPQWIFVDGLKGEPFLTLAGNVFIFGLLQGIIRLYGKSVLPNILLSIVYSLVLGQGLMSND